MLAVAALQQMRCRTRSTVSATADGPEAQRIMAVGGSGGRSVMRRGKKESAVLLLIAAVRRKLATHNLVLVRDAITKIANFQRMVAAKCE